MARAEKQAAVAEIVDSFNDAAGAVLTEYRGLTVKELQDLRRSLGENADYAVVKNTLAKLAATEVGISGFDELLTGPTAIAFGTDEAGTAKAVLDATRPYRIVRVTGGVLGDRAIDADGVTRLATLPSREVLLAKLAGGMQSPTATLAGLLAANIRNLGYALTQVRDQKAAAGG